METLKKKVKTNRVLDRHESIKTRDGNLIKVDIERKF